MIKKVIYTSDLLRKSKATSVVASSIANVLKQCGVEHKELTDTKDYWCRDYMPILLFNDDVHYCGFKYDPDYLKEINLTEYKTDQDFAIKDLNFRNFYKSNLVLDGGNFVRCGTKIIMTDKMLMENSGCDQIVLLQELFHYLHGEPLLIPWDMEEECGHADGMVACLGDGKILLNNFKQLLCKRSLPYYRRLIKTLEPHFEIVELEYDCKVDKNSWCYLNYLEIENAILLPTLSPDSNSDNDLAAIELFQKLFPHKKIFPIYSLPLIKRGGALHCVTWEYNINEEPEMWDYF